MHKRALYALIASMMIAVSGGFAVATHGGGSADHPDITITDISSTPADPLEGENVTFTATVRNNGSADTATSFNVTFLVDGEQVGENKTVDAPLRFGEAITVTSDNWTAVPARHDVGVIADAHDDVAEDDEDNNEATATVFGATAEPNLVLAELTWDPASPVAGENVTLNATVENTGNVSAENVSVRFLIDGSVVGADQPIASLAPGASVHVTSQAWTSTAGDHEAKAIADPNDAFAEANEIDNERAETLSVASDEADLVITGITLLPEDPEVDENTTFTATVENQGHTATGTFTVRFLVNGSHLGEDVNVSSLAPGENTTVESANWSAADGDNTVRALADAGENVTEADETNNDHQQSFVVGDHGPDLVADELEASSQDPAPGQDVTFTTTVENDGDRDAAGFTVTFLVDGEQVGENKSVSALTAGQSTTVTSDAWNATQGEHTVEVLVDSQDDVAELDEGNNAASTPLTVDEDQAPPDDDETGQEEEGEETVTICHRPPGNPDNEHTITIGEPAWKAHERHGDSQGACEEDAGDRGASTGDEGEDQAEAGNA